MQHIREPKNLVAHKMTKTELNNLSWDKHGELKVKKRVLDWVWYYTTHPYVGDSIKNIVCTWANGVAHIPKSWMNSQDKTKGPS